MIVVVSNEQAWIGVGISVISSPATLLLIQNILKKRKERADVMDRYRLESQDIISHQLAEIKQLESELDKWRKEYYDLREKYATLLGEYSAAAQRLRGRE